MKHSFPLKTLSRRRDRILHLDEMTATAKKPDVDEHPQMSIRVGLLRNELPGVAGLPFI